MGECFSWLLSILWLIVLRLDVLISVEIDLTAFLAFSLLLFSAAFESAAACQEVKFGEDLIVSTL